MTSAEVHQARIEQLATAVFVAGLPRGPKGDLVPGHTTWEQLGPQARDRYRRMARSVVNELDR